MLNPTSTHGFFDINISTASSSTGEPSSSVNDITDKTATAALPTITAASGTPVDTAGSAQRKAIIRKLCASATPEQSARMIAAYKHAVEAARKAAEESELDPSEGENQLNELFLTAMEDKKQGVDSWSQIGTTVLGVRWKNNKLRVLQFGDYIASGTYGTVYQIKDATTGKLKKVLKIANTADHVKVKARKSINMESRILKEIHKSGHVVGIQNAPDEVLKIISSGEATDSYIATPYDLALNEPEYKQQQSFVQRLAGAGDLLSGLKSAHAAGYVHRDIKPGNCCSYRGEHQIADWGDAKSLDTINLLKPLGVHSPFYTSDEDETEGRNISGYYGLHLAATGANTDRMFVAKSLNYLLLNYFNDETGATLPDGFDDQLIRDSKLYIASVIKDMDADELAGQYVLFKDLYEIEIEDARDADIPMPDLSRFVMTADELQQLTEKSQNLCKRHDVFSMAVTILQNLTSIDVQDKSYADLESADLYTIMLRDLDSVNPKISQLLYDDFIIAPADLRPSAEEFHQRFTECF